MAVRERFMRRWMWGSAALAAAASLADQPPHCPLETELGDRVVVEPAGADWVRHFTVRASSFAGASVTIEATTADADNPSATLEAWVLNDTPSEALPDAMRTLEVHQDVTASTTVPVSRRFELGLRAVGTGPVAVRFVVNAETDDCSDSPFVRIDVE